MKLLATTFCDILSTASTAASPFRPSQRNVSTWSSVLVIVVDSQPHAAREKEILERVQEIGGYGNARCGYWQGEAVVGGEGNRGSERVRTDSSIREHDASYGIPSPETNPVKSPLLPLCTSRRAARIKGSSNKENGDDFFRRPLPRVDRRQHFQTIATKCVHFGFRVGHRRRW